MTSSRDVTNLIKEACNRCIVCAKANFFLCCTMQSYLQGVQILLDGAVSDSDSRRQEAVRAKVDSYLKCAEKLRYGQQQSQQVIAPLPLPAAALAQPPTVKPQSPPIEPLPHTDEGMLPAAATLPVGAQGDGGVGSNLDTLSRPAAATPESISPTTSPKGSVFPSLLEFDPCFNDGPEVPPPYSEDVCDNCEPAMEELDRRSIDAEALAQPGVLQQTDDGDHNTEQELKFPSVPTTPGPLSDEEYVLRLPSVPKDDGDEIEKHIHSKVRPPKKDRDIFDDAIDAVLKDKHAPKLFLPGVDDRTSQLRSLLASMHQEDAAKAEEGAGRDEDDDPPFVLPSPPSSEPHTPLGSGIKPSVYI